MQTPFLLLGFMTAKDGSCKECDTIVLYHKLLFHYILKFLWRNLAPRKKKKKWNTTPLNLLEILFFSDRVKYIIINMFYK